MANEDGKVDSSLVMQKIEELEKPDSDTDSVAERRNRNFSNLSQFNVHQNIFAVDEIFDMNCRRVEKSINAVHKMTLPRTELLYFHKKTDLNSLMREKKKRD